tara:strand:+ start:743 stop:1195 length:453 start_codon:yes stop_codon:yes gene_type:complete
MAHRSTTDPTVAEALDDFLEANGFSTDAYDSPTVPIPFGPWTIPLPSTPGRRALVRFHDLHHVATGYGADYVGEAEIGAWELRAGCDTLAAWLYNGLAVSAGLVLNPLRVWRAFRRARSMRTLYRVGRPYEELLDLRLGELRALIGLEGA